MFRPLMILSGAIALLLPFLAPAVSAQTPPGTITGLVTATDGSAVSDAEVLLVALHRRTSTDADGSFRFAAVPPGDYLLEAKSPRFGSAVARVSVAADNGDAGVEMIVALVSHEDEIVVTGSVLRSQLELAQPTTVLTGEELAFRVQPSLGETLGQEPGVASTFFGAGASRPVIRGLGGDRIRTLEDGLGTGDVSTTSPDHAVAADPATAERIEVLRGPATLLYGSSAIGGVVNVIDGRIPDVRSDLALGGFVELRGGSADGERAGVIDLTGGSERWAWHLDAVSRQTDDYDIPGFAALEGDEHEEEHGEEEHAEEENAFGTLPNSDLETIAGSLGVTRFFGDSGFLGISVGGYDSEYGIPGGEHGHENEEHGEEEHEEGDEHGESIRVDLERQRFDLRGEITRPIGVFQALKARFGAVDYEHAELEGDSREIGTRFFNDSWEGRLEFIQKPRGSLSGSVGLQVRNQDLEAVGAEAFIPATDLTSYGVFAFEEFERGDLRLQLGARFESQDTNAGGLPSRSFDGLSGSFGVVWVPADGYSVGVSLARSTKLPNAEELYSDGPHLATRAFEIGDPNLDQETSLGFDVSLRKKSGKLRGELSLFRNDFDDFIFGAFTGEEEDGLEVLQFTQADAEFTGAELKAFVELWQNRSQHHLDLKLTGDTVRAELSDSGEPLPRIPPRRLSAGLHFHTSKWHAFAEARRVEEQERVAANETPTGGYTFLNAGLSYRLILGGNVYDIRLRGTNLTDEEGRNHVSFLKDAVPLPGRNVSLAFRWSF